MSLIYAILIHYKHNTNIMTLRIFITGDGLSFEKEVEMHRAGQIIAFLSSDVVPEVSVIQPHSAPSLLGVSESPRKSPRQSLNDSDAKTNVEKIVVLGNHFCTQRELDSFSPKDVQGEFKRAGEALPKNMTRDFNTAIAQGYILENDEGEYSLTDLGLEVIGTGFTSKQRTMRTSPGKKRRGSGKTGRGPAVREEVLNLELTPQLDGYPDYWTYTIKGSRILWLLAYAAEHGITDGLSSGEVEYLASKLKDQITSQAFAALTKSNIKKGYMTSTKGYSKILKVGEDFLKAQEQ